MRVLGLKMPFGNGKEAAKLAAMFRLTQIELNSAKRKVLLNRLGAIAVSWTPEFAFIPIYNFTHNPDLSIGLLFGGFGANVYCISRFAFTFFTSPYRDYSVVAQAIKDKTGNWPDSQLMQWGKFQAKPNLAFGSA